MLCTKINKLIKWKLFSLLVLFMSATFAISGLSDQLYLEDSKFSLQSESNVLINTIGQVKQQSFVQDTTGDIVNVFDFGENKNLKLTGRKMTSDLTKNGLSITSWYVFNTFFVIDFLDNTKIGQNKFGVMLLGYNSKKHLYAVSYLKNQAEKSIKWDHHNSIELQMRLKILTVRDINNADLAFVKQTSVVKNTPTFKFMEKVYQLKDSHLLGTSQQPLGMAYEFLPVQQNLAEWENLITINIMISSSNPLQYAENAFKLLQQSKRVLVEPLVTNKQSGAVYLTTYEVSRAFHGDGSVYTRGGKNYATADLAKTKADLINEYNIHKLYTVFNRKNILFDVSYSERRYGNLQESEFNTWNKQLGTIVDKLDNLDLSEQLSRLQLNASLQK